MNELTTEGAVEIGPRTARAAPDEESIPLIDIRAPGVYAGQGTRRLLRCALLLFHAAQPLARYRC